MIALRVRPSRGIAIWLAFLMLCLIWGSSYLFIRIALRHLSPTPLVALRLLLGTAVIVAIASSRRQRMRVDRRQAGALLAAATINTAAPFWLISWGETTVPSGLASVLNSTVPIFSVLLAALVLADEPLTVPRLGGVVLGFAGVVLLLSRDLAHGGAFSSALGGQLAIILASVCYAVGAVWVRRTLRGLPSLTIATYVLIISAAEMVVVSLLFSRPDFGHFHGDTLGAILWLGILGSGIAYLLAYAILAEWGAARYTLVAYALPIVGLTLGALVLREALDWRILAGSALVILGVGLASIARRRAGETPGSRDESQVERVASVD